MLQKVLPALPPIDKLIHEPVRLHIMAYLFVVKNTDMLFLKNQTKLTWGNLSSHISRLEASGYIHVEKLVKGKKTSTRLSLTKKGRQAFQDYQTNLSRVLGWENK